jgi:nucleoside-diphosphate-sugar epimerase
VGLLSASLEGPVNIGTGQGVAIADVAREIAAIIGRPDLLHLGALPEAPDDPPRLVADSGRLQTLGVAPVYSLYDGLRQTIDWWTERLAVRSDVVC